VLKALLNALLVSSVRKFICRQDTLFDYVKNWIDTKHFKVLTGLGKNSLVEPFEGALKNNETSTRSSLISIDLERCEYSSLL